MCPNGMVCQDAKGAYSRCGMMGGGGGSPDGGGPFWCQFIPCQDDGICKQSGCASCDVAKQHCQ